MGGWVGGVGAGFGGGERHWGWMENVFGSYMNSVMEI